MFAGGKPGAIFLRECWIFGLPRSVVPEYVPTSLDSSDLRASYALRQDVGHAQDERENPRGRVSAFSFDGGRYSVRVQ